MKPEAAATVASPIPFRKAKATSRRELRRVVRSS